MADPILSDVHDAQTMTAATYDAAADHFDHPALSFWATAGQATVEHLDLTPGAKVLDVGAGSGASALPAAEIVGPSGRVVAVDLSARLLDLANEKAAVRGLTNLRTRVADMTDLGYRDRSFDSVICVFAVFFLPDMVDGIRGLWRLVEPGGRLAVTTWGPGIFEPLYEPFWNAVEAERSDLVKRFNPWDSLVEPARLSELFTAAGTPKPAITRGSHPTRVATPGDWWSIVLGSGLRGTVEQLSAEEVAAVRRSNDRAVAALAPVEVRADVLYAVATKHN